MIMAMLDFGNYRRRLVAPLMMATLLGGLSAAGVCHADTTDQDKLAATALFKQGRELMQQKRYREACIKFSESQRLDPGGGTLLNLATCHEKTGQIATAWGEYTRALGLARQVGRQDRITLAESRIAELEKRLPHLSLKLAASAQVPGLVLKRDSQKIPKALWNSPMPVDPGTHVISAEANGHRGWFQRIKIKEGQTIQLPIPKLEAAPSTPPGGKGVRPNKKEPAAPPPPPKKRSKIRLYAGIIGAAGLAGSAIFGLNALSKKNQVDKECEGGCTAEAKSLNDDALRNADIASGLFVVGLLGVGTYLLWPEPKPDETGVNLSAGATPQGGEISLWGRF